MNILIVKHGAMGDVLRTTPLLTAYKRLYPHCRITWIVEKASSPVLLHNPLIDRLIIYSEEALRELSKERFDIAINLDKEKEALDSIAAANAAVKRGFGWNSGRSGLVALNPASEYALRLGVDDELKFRINQKTYQEISFEQAELPYSKEEYILHVDDEEKRAADSDLALLGITSGAIGINTGSGDRFAGKRLSLEQLAELSRGVHTRTGRKAVLLGGPQEIERNARIQEMARDYAVDSGTSHRIHRFAAIVSRLGCVVTGDTIAMHIAIAVKVPVVVFFGSTCASEIELYGRGEKIVSDLSCAPCYKRICPIDESEKCMTDIPSALIMKSVARVLGMPPGRKSG